MAPLKIDIFTCGEASRSMDDIWLLPSVFSEIQPFRGQRGTGTWVIGFKDENLRILTWPADYLLSADCLLFQNMQIWLQ